MNVDYFGSQVPDEAIRARLSVFIQLTRYWPTLKTDIINAMSDNQRKIFRNTFEALQKLFPDGSWTEKKCFVLTFPMDHNTFLDLIYYRSKYCVHREHYLLEKIRKSASIKTWAQQLIGLSPYSNGRLDNFSWPECMLNHMIQILDKIEGNPEQPFGFFWSSTTQEMTSVVSKLIFWSHPPAFSQNKMRNGHLDAENKNSAGENNLKMEKKSLCWTVQVQKIIKKDSNVKEQVQLFISGKQEQNARLLIRHLNGQIRWQWQLLDKESVDKDIQLGKMLTMARKRNAIVVTKMDESLQKGQHYLALFPN